MPRLTRARVESALFLFSALFLLALLRSLIALTLYGKPGRPCGTRTAADCNVPATATALDSALPRWDLSSRFGFASPFSEDVDAHLSETRRLAQAFRDTYEGSLSSPSTSRSSSCQLSAVKSGSAEAQVSAFLQLLSAFLEGLLRRLQSTAVWCGTLRRWCAA